MIPAILALAQLAPAVLGLVHHKHEGTAERAARVVAETAKAVTGVAGEREALDAIKANPKMMADFISQVNAASAALYAEETERLETVNETIRAEAVSSDPYVRRWRPTWGYVTAASWAAMFGVICYTVVVSPAEAPGVITALAGLTAMWSVALAVLGISVYQRSQDKRPPRPGAFQTISALLRPGPR